MQLSLFLGSIGIMEGRSPLQIRERFVDLYKIALIANWKIWPLAQVYPRQPLAFTYITRH